MTLEEAPKQPKKPEKKINLDDIPDLDGGTIVKKE